MIVRSGRRSVCRRAREAGGFLERFRGLQWYRRFPGAFDGLLFPRCRAVHTFFTFVRPDILFLDPEGKVMVLCGEVPPWRVRMGPKGTTATLELPGGTARRLRLKRGALLRFEE